MLIRNRNIFFKSVTGLSQVRSFYQHPRIQLPNQYVLEAESRLLFNNARAGQGFAGMAFSDDGKMTVCLRPAFNKNDGLPKEDKHQRIYREDEMIEGTVPFGTTGVGQIHRNLYDAIISKQKRADRLELYGSAIGFGLFKGGCMEDSALINVHLMTREQALPLLVSKKNKEPACFPYHHAFILVRTAHGKIDDIIYIINGRIVHCSVNTTNEPISLTNEERRALEKRPYLTLPMSHSIPKKALIALNLHRLVRAIRNKSANLNLASLHYDTYFSNYIRYMAKQDFSAELIDNSTHINLLRSVPINMMTTLSHFILSELGVHQSDIQAWMPSIQKDWDNSQYEAKWEDFLKTSPETKLKIYVENIYITIGMMIDAIKQYLNPEITADQSPFKRTEKLNHYLLDLHQALIQLITCVQHALGELKHIDETERTLFYQTIYNGTSPLLKNTRIQQAAPLNLSNMIKELSSLIDDINAVHDFVPTLSFRNILPKFDMISKIQKAELFNAIYMLYLDNYHKTWILFFSFLRRVEATTEFKDEKIQFWNRLLHAKTKNEKTLLTHIIENGWVDLLKAFSNQGVDVKIPDDSFNLRKGNTR